MLQTLQEQLTSNGGNRAFLLADKSGGLGSLLFPSVGWCRGGGGGGAGNHSELGDVTVKTAKKSHDTVQIKQPTSNRGRRALVVAIGVRQKVRISFGFDW
jgi:hypothetical protein